MRYAAPFILLAGLVLGAGVSMGRADDAESDAKAKSKAKDDKSDKAESTEKEGETGQATEPERWTGEGISWAVPEGWEQQEGQGPRFATLVAGEGDQRVEITVTVFPGTVGGKLANINRWRMQVGLDPIDEDDLADTTSEVEVDGQPATLVDFTGSGEGEDAKRLVAAMIPRGEQTWFVKALGASEAVAAQREALETFVTSIDFDDGDEDEADEGETKSKSGTKKSAK